MMMDAGWALTVFRFSMAVFFVIVSQSCLHVCMSPLTWVEMTHGSSSDTDDSGETACDGAEDTTEIKRCLDVNQSGWSLPSLVVSVWYMHANLM